MKRWVVCGLLLLGLALGGGLWWFGGRSGRRLLEVLRKKAGVGLPVSLIDVQRELRAHDEAAAVKQELVRSEHAAVVARIKAEHEAEILRMDIADQEKLVELEADPIALTKFLVRKSAFILLFLLGAFVVPSSWAAEVECREGTPTMCAVGLKRGEGAPFAGQLLTPKLAAHLAVVEDGVDRRVALAVTATVARWKEEARFVQRMGEIERTALVAKAETREAAFSRELAALSKAREEDVELILSTHYGLGTVLLVGAVCVVAGVGVTFGAVALAKELKEVVIAP